MELKDHVLILGFGSAGMWVVKPLRQAGYEVLVVDDDPTVIEGLGNSRIPCLRGDGSDPQVLDLVRAREAKLIVASVPRLQDLVQIIRYTKGVEVIARAFEDSEIRTIENEGGVAISNAEAADEAFGEWLENFLRKKEKAKSPRE